MKFRVVLVLLCLLVSSARAEKTYTDCNAVKEVVEIFLKSHRFHFENTPEIRKRAVENFFIRAGLTYIGDKRKEIKWQLEDFLTDFKNCDLIPQIQKESENKLKEVHEYYADLISAYANALDPWSEYTEIPIAKPSTPPDPQASKDSKVAIEPTLSLGMNVLLLPNGTSYISQIVAGGPADGADLHAGDQIIAVKQGEDTYKAPAFIAKIKLIKDVPFTFIIRRLFKEQNKLKVKVAKISVTPATFRSSSEDTVTVKYTFITSKIENYLIAHIQFDKFFSGLNKEFENAIKKINTHNPDLIALHMQNNLGGSVDEIAPSAGLFFKTAAITKLRAPLLKFIPEFLRSWSIYKDTLYNDTNPSLLYAGPLMILVSSNTASAAETFTAALKDYGRALVVGSSRTYGKGMATREFEWSQKYSSKITLALFETIRPSGQTLHRTGVSSHLFLEDPPGFRRYNNYTHKIPLPNTSHEPFLSPPEETGSGTLWKPVSTDFVSRAWAKTELLQTRSQKLEEIAKLFIENHR